MSLDAALAAFLAGHDDTESPHLPLVRTAIAAGTCRLESVSATPVNSTELLDIYRFRARHLGQFDTPHANALRSDVTALVNALESGLDDGCRIFSFDFDDGHVCSFFEASSGRLLGAILARSKSKTPPDVWESLWRSP